MTRRDGSARIADALRASPPALDDLRRARMERRLLDGVHASGRPREQVGGAARRAKGDGETRGRAAWAAGGALVAAAAALAIAWIVWPDDGATEVAGARFVITGTSTVDGTIDSGSTLEVGAGQRAELQVGSVTIEAAGISASTWASLRVGSLDPRDVQVELTEGSIDVAFHPRVRGEEHLSIETPSARVEVVGTEFTVRLEHGGTRVTVREGVVRVVPHAAEQSAVLVRAGQTVAIGVSSPLARERSAAELRQGADDSVVVVDETGEAVATVEAVEVAEAAPGIGVRPAAARAVSADVVTLVEPTPAEEAAAEAAAEAPEPTAEAPAAEETPVAETTIDPEAITFGEALPTEGETARGAGALGAPTVAPPPHVPPRMRLDSALRYARAGNHDRARALLGALLRSPDVGIGHRVEAYTLIGDSYRAQREYSEAAEAYETAARLGRGRAEGHIAIAQLARLQQHDLGDAAAALETYRRYMREAPNGSNARTVAAAVQRLEAELAREAGARRR